MLTFSAIAAHARSLSPLPCYPSCSRCLANYRFSSTYSCREASPRPSRSPSAPSSSCRRRSPRQPIPAATRPRSGSTRRGPRACQKASATSIPMSVGASAVLLPERLTPEAVFRTLKHHQPTVFFGVPALYAGMLAYPQGTRDMSSQRLRLCVSAGEALPAEVGKAFRDKFGVDVLDGVGSTEMLHQYVCNSPAALKYGTSGRPVEGYEIRLVDEQGRDVPDGEVGEMLVKGPSAAEGYWNQREKSRTTFEGGWTRSGDKYTRDAEGYYTYQGRTDDMFKVSGIWVSPFEVESALISHEAVLEAAVVPKKDGDGLLKPKAFIVLKPGKSAGNGLQDALKEHVKAKAGMWKYPRWIEIVDGLPKTATGKIQRFKLREE